MEMLPKQQMQSGSGGPQTGGSMTLEQRMAAAEAEHRTHASSLERVSESKLSTAAERNTRRPTSYIHQ